MYNFTVHVVMVPYIVCTPDTGYVGDSFSVTGVNFLDYVGTYVTIYFENSIASPYYKLMLNFTVPSSSWTTAALTVPNSYGGPRYVEARITDGTTIIAYDIYTVLTMIDVVPDIIDNNCSIIQVIGTGFWTGMYGEEEGYIEDWFFYIDNSMYFGDDEDWASGINATGYILTEFVAAGFRPGLHEVHVIPDSEGSLPWFVLAKDCFIVSTVGDPIVDYLASINATVTSISDGMVTLETSMGELTVSLAALDAKVVAIDSAVATISTNVGTIKTSVSSISSKVTSIDNNMASIETSLGTVRTSLTSLDATITALDEDMATIQTVLGEIQTSLESLDASITSIEGDVATIQTSLGTIEGTITDIEGTLATVETDLGTVKLDVGSVKTDVDESLPVTVDMTPVWIAVVLALIAAIGSIAGVFIIQRKIAG
jgi:copper chaperone CopZ